MGSKILLADDSITIQKVVNLTFADEGIDVVAVNNGDVAERRMDEVRPDLVLADIFMPGKNGYELCESIKNSQFRNVPVVLLVGAFEPFDQAEAKRVRADAHLTKPFESRTLVETVRKLINSTSHPAGGPVPAMSAAGEPDDIHADVRDGMRDDRGTGSIAARVTAPPTPRLDLSAMTDAQAPSPVSARATAELTQRLSAPTSEAFEVNIAQAPARETVTATLIDTDEPFQTMELSSSGFSLEQFTSTLSLEPTEPVLDFEKSELFESHADEATLSFDVQPEAVLDVDVTGAESVTNKFESIGQRPVDDIWSESAQFEAQEETASVAPASSVLAAEDPLGDILEGAVPIEGTPFQQAHSSDSLSLDLPEVESSGAAPVSSRQFDLVEILEASQQPAADVEEPTHAHQSSQRSADWTSPDARSYSTAQLDSVVMPTEVAAYLKNKSLEEAPMEAAQEASFSTPSKWADEEAHFTAIDIEAVSVDDSQSRAGASDRSEPADYVQASAADSQTEATNGGSASSELSAASIEAIVRRVISEKSDSVVREVAWEVVPDCVERVVSQLTRESLSRRG